MFASPTPEKPGYEIVAAEEPADGGAAAPAAPQPIGPLLAAADPKAGEAVFKKCAACHTGGEGRRQQGRAEPVGHRQPADRLT